MQHLFNATGQKETLDSVLRGDNLATWQESLSNAIGQLAQGNDHGVISTDIIDFIHTCEVPQGRDVTYTNFILDYCPLKVKKHQVHLVVGGAINCPILRIWSI